MWKTSGIEFCIWCEVEIKILFFFSPCAYLIDQASFLKRPPFFTALQGCLCTFDREDRDEGDEVQVECDFILWAAGILTPLLHLKRKKFSFFIPASGNLNCASPSRIPRVRVLEDEEGSKDIELSDDPYDCIRLSVENVPCIVTLCKVCGCTDGFWIPCGSPSTPTHLGYLIGWEVIVSQTMYK